MSYQNNNLLVNEQLDCFSHDYDDDFLTASRDPFYPARYHSQICGGMGMAEHQRLLQQPLTLAREQPLPEQYHHGHNMQYAQKLICQDLPLVPSFSDSRYTGQSVSTALPADEDDFLSCLSDYRKDPKNHQVFDSNTPCRQMDAPIAEQAPARNMDKFKLTVQNLDMFFKDTPAKAAIHRPNDDISPTMHQSLRDDRDLSFATHMTELRAPCMDLIAEDLIQLEPAQSLSLRGQASQTVDTTASYLKEQQSSNVEQSSPLLRIIPSVKPSSTDCNDKQPKKKHHFKFTKALGELTAAQK